MNATTALRLLVAETSRARALELAATERLARRLKPASPTRLVARRIGLALIRVGETLAGPTARPARAR